MVKLENANFTKYGSVQIKDIDLENFAYRQLREYKKNYFKNPQPLDIDDFVEFYLKKKVQYYQLSTNDSKVRPLGTTVITDGGVAVINEEGVPTIEIFKQGTIIIDESACKCETRRRFTLAHEAWHAQFDLHLNINLLDSDNSINDSHTTLSKIYQKGLTKTPRDWVEYHADIYSVYLLMPRVFINKLFSKYHKQFFGDKRRLTANRASRTWIMINAIANELNISKTAIAYRLRELNKISNDIFVSLNINAHKEVADVL